MPSVHSRPVRPGAALIAAALLATFAAAAPAQQVLAPDQREEAQFGYAVTALPDVDGDGIDDFAASAPQFIDVDGQAPDTLTDGRIYIYSGAAGTLIRTITAPFANDAAGRSLAGVPDLDNDGRGDLVVGALEAAYVYSGATGALIRTLRAPDDERFSYFAIRVAGLSDINNDGRGDIAVNALEYFPELSPDGAPGNDPVAGRVFIFSGRSGILLRSIPSPRGPRAVDGNDISTRAIFGWSIAAVPDVNNDGYDDMVIGEPVPAVSAPVGYRPRVYVFSGRSGRLLRTFIEPRNRAGTNFGEAVAGVPDLNNDGRGDIIVGAPFARPGSSGIRTGLVYVFSGRTGRFLRQIGPPQLQGMGRFGEAVAGVPDANADGRGDILIGAPGEGPNRPGRAYLHSGRSGIRLRTFNSPNPEQGGNFGSAVAGLGDANGNGRAEVLIAAPREDLSNAEPNVGRAYRFRF